MISKSSASILVVAAAGLLDVAAAEPGKFLRCQVSGDPHVQMFHPATGYGRFGVIADYRCARRGFRNRKPEHCNGITGDTPVGKLDYQGRPNELNGRGFNNVTMQGSRKNVYKYVDNHAFSIQATHAPGMRSRPAWRVSRIKDQSLRIRNNADPAKTTKEHIVTMDWKGKSMRVESFAVTCDAARCVPLCGKSDDDLCSHSESTNCKVANGMYTTLDNTTGPCLYDGVKASFGGTSTLELFVEVGTERQWECHAPVPDDEQGNPRNCSTGSEEGKVHEFPCGPMDDGGTTCFFLTTGDGFDTKFFSVTKSAQSQTRIELYNTTSFELKTWDALRGHYDKVSRKSFSTGELKNVRRYVVEPNVLELRFSKRRRAAVFFSQVGGSDFETKIIFKEQFIRMFVPNTLSSFLNDGGKVNTNGLCGFPSSLRSSSDKPSFTLPVANAASRSTANCDTEVIGDQTVCRHLAVLDEKKVARLGHKRNLRKLTRIFGQHFEAAVTEIFSPVHRNARHEALNTYPDDLDAPEFLQKLLDHHNGTIFGVLADADAPVDDSDNDDENHNAVVLKVEKACEKLGEDDGFSRDDCIADAIEATRDVDAEDEEAIAAAAEGADAFHEDIDDPEYDVDDSETGDSPSILGSGFTLETLVAATAGTALLVAAVALVASRRKIKSIRADHSRALIVLQNKASAGARTMEDNL